MFIHFYDHVLNLCQMYYKTYRLCATGDLPKGVLLAHIFNVYFSPQPGEYNGLIVHVCASFFSLCDIHECSHGL